MWFLPCYSNQNAGISTSSQSVQVVDFNAPVVNTLTQLWQPFLSQGKLVEHYIREKTLFKESTVVKLDTNDLTTTAVKLCKPDAPGLEIDSFLLGTEAVEAIKKQIDLTTLFPGQKVEMVARKLLIATTAYQNGRCSYNLDPTQERIGIVEVLLNSAFTGGELQVMCGDQSTDLQSVPYSWVAMHSDVSCSLSPVTSGARVSLIYDVNIVHVPVDSTPLFIEGFFVHTNCNLISDMTDAAFDVTKLISIAEQMNPELVGRNDLSIDPCVLNASTLTALGRKAELSDYFGTEYVTTKPKCLVIHRRTEKYTTREETNMDLGPLVMTLGTDYNNNLAYLRRDEQQTYLRPETRRWYAYRADTKQNIHIYVCGTVVALHYDVYACKRPDLIHNPLPTGDTISGTDSILTRSIVPELLSAQILGELEMELASADAAIITLQHLFPEGPTDQLWNTYPSYLQRGDRVLYDVLTGTSPDTSHFSERYSVHLVEITIRCHYERGVCRDRIVSEKCTFKPFADPLAIPTKYTEPCNVKLIVATKLTGKHSVNSSYTLNKMYQVFGFYVSKKM